MVSPDYQPGRDETVIDYQGQPIRLPWERWLHIIDPAGRHSYMASMRAELEETLKDPDLIVRSTVFPDIGRIYHKWYEHTVIGAKWVLVVVYRLADDDAFVATAYVKGEVIAGEVLWNKAGQ